VNKPERRKLRAQQRLANINKEWRKEVIDKQNGNTYQSAMMAPSIVVLLSSEVKDQLAMEGWTRREMVHFAKHAKVMDISEDPAGCVQRTRRASTMKVRPLNSTVNCNKTKTLSPM
jgi:hypothetical protein